MGYNLSKLKVLLILLIFVASLIVIFRSYPNTGFYWDFGAHILNAKAYIAFVKLLPNPTALRTAIDSGTYFYFEAYREPLPSILLVPFILLSENHFVYFYDVFIFLLLLAACLYLARSMNIDPLIVAVLVFTPYVILYNTLLNGGEVLALIFLLFTFGLVTEKNEFGGLALALAGLSTYVSLIFLPILIYKTKQKGAKNTSSITVSHSNTSDLFWWTKKGQRQFLWFIIGTAPLLVFNTIFYGDPLFSYLSSIGTFAATNAGPHFLSPMIFTLQIILPSLSASLILITGAFLYLCLIIKRDRTFNREKLGRAGFVLFIALILGVIGWLIVSATGTINDVPRMGYVIYAPMAAIIAFALDRQIYNHKFPNFMRILVLASICIVLAALLFNTYFRLKNNQVFGSFNGSDAPAILTAVNALNRTNLIKCNIITNGWIYLRLNGITGLYPFSPYAVGKKYPVVLFKNVGIGSLNINILGDNDIVTNPNFDIYLPQNYSCA
jgi:hypothetical protein